jgi:hypothetical protein
MMIIQQTLEVNGSGTTARLHKRTSLAVNPRSECTSRVAKTGTPAIRQSPNW